MAELGVVNEKQLGELIWQRFAAGVDSAESVVWQHEGDELLIHPETVAVQALDGVLIISIDVECDQTGRTSLATVLALGTLAEQPLLIAATEGRPRGSALVATRWGSALGGAVWGALLDIATELADARNSLPRGIACGSGTVAFH